jgi:hypothetical protein
MNTKENTRIEANTIEAPELMAGIEAANELLADDKDHGILFLEDGEPHHPDVPEKEAPDVVDV